MSATSRSSDQPGSDFTALAAAVSEGRGFRPVASAASRILDAALAIIDRSSAVLAVVAPSPEEEDRLRSGGKGVKRRRLEVAGRPVGELRLFRRGSTPIDPDLLEVVAALVALELERARSGERADEDDAADLVEAVLSRRLFDPVEIASRAANLGTDLGEGAGVIIARLRGMEGQGQGFSGGDAGRAALAAGLRTLRSSGRGALAALAGDGEYGEIRAIVATPDREYLERMSRATGPELADAIGGGDSAGVTVGCSRWTERPEELFRAGKEALLALNVAEAESAALLSFEETGSYRLLLHAMSENPVELEWFYADTVAPLVAYDRQYGTDLVGTVEAFLRNDGNIAPTAEELFTHRHTVRYRLGRVHDLCGHDIRTTDGREQLGFGLKAMRVLGPD